MTNKKLMDITKIKIDTTLSKQDRIMDYISKVKNPYHFMVGDVEVSIEYGDENITLENILENHFSKI